jgi:sugar phosphate isomerase/epimerase
MSQLHDLARPGLMLSQTWPASREKEDETLRALEACLEHPFYTSFQTVEVPFKNERKKIARLLAPGNSSYTYCLARVLNESGLNLSDLDETNRKNSYQRTIACLDDAREAGAGAVTLISGPVPDDPNDRKRALDLLADSLARIIEEGNKTPALRIVIEPLDVDAHKRMTLGYIQEVVGVCRGLRDAGLDLFLCMDTAHMILNGEDPAEALAQVKDSTAEFHYCNCVTRRDHPLYGDRHIRFGEPGVLDVQDIGRLMERQVAMGFFNTDAKPVIMCEVLKKDNDRSQELLQYSADVMSRAWEMADNSGGR